MDKERSLLHRAIEIALEGIEKGKGPFGAVIAMKGKIIAEASNTVVISHDPTAHAEIMAIREASERLKTHDLSDCIIYCSCEPCPMCLGAIYWSGIKTIVYASGREDAARAGFSDSMIYDELVKDPENRKLSFIRMHDPESFKVFRKWHDYDGKVPY